MSSLLNINTKLEAFKLINDLLSLLYSKYGDIKEDFYSSFINQILYDKNSKFNINYKEIEYNDFIDEFLKRFYRIDESKIRIPKLSEYYKNYHKFFCRPFFRNFTLTTVIRKYGDKKAEIFYKDNYADDIDDKENKNNNSNEDESSLSSLDNITNNKTIFDKKTKLLLDKPSNI